MSTTRSSTPTTRQRAQSASNSPHHSLNSHQQSPPSTASRHVRWGQQTACTLPEAQESDSDEEEVEEGLEGIVLAMTSLHGKLGCSYFDPATNKLYFLEDQSESSSLDLTSLILSQLLPSNVLTSIGADPAFLSHLETVLASLPLAPTSSASASSTNDDSPVRLEIRPPRDFYAGQGRNLLAKLDIREGRQYSRGEAGVADLDDFAQNDGSRNGEGWREHRGGDAPREWNSRPGGGMENDATRRNRELRLEAFIDSLGTSPLTLGCAGALLSSLSRMKASAGDLEADQLEIAGLELMHLDKIMQINAESLASLQVFDQEAHASMHSSSGKEGLSVFGIANLTRTPLGDTLMRQWFVRPSLELDVIEQRHETVACFLRPENATATDAIRSNLKIVKNAPKALASLLHGRGKVRDWQNLWQMLYGAVMIRDAALTLTRTRKVTVVERLGQAIDAGSFRSVGKAMNDIIDWERTGFEKSRVCVRPGVDETLDKLRRGLDGLPSLLSRIAADLAEQLPKDLVPELVLVYFPQLGYLVRTHPDTGSDYLDACAQYGLDFQFASEVSSYFKNAQCRDLDHHMGDLQSLVVDKEIEIIQALLDEIAGIEDSVRATSEAISELDCRPVLLAFAEAARDYNWNRPAMSSEPVCKIRGGRHPLAELTVSTFIKNDTELIGGRGVDWIKEEDDIDQEGKATNSNEKSMIIVTGANFSGKSVYLKQVALITYMAHLGCFVPAEQALIGLTDRIMTRVSTRESITRGSSAFMIDLQQISFALRNLTPSSLLIIDEFGKGTEPNDGAGLFCGVVDYLVRLGRDTPRVAIASHLQAVFINGLVSRQQPIHLAHMDILVHDAQSSSSRVTSTDSSSTDSRGSGRDGGVETLTYLYRLAPGLMTYSYAASCAQLFGIPPSVVERATFVTQALERFDIESIHKTHRGSSNCVDEGEDRDVREFQENIEVTKRFLDWNLDEMEQGKDGCDVEVIKQRLLEVLEGD